MKILYSWLKDFIDLNNSPENIGEKIFIHSLNVEEIKEDKKIGDAIFDIELTPDRGDCASHLGIARELAAIYNKKLKDPIKATFSQSQDSIIDVEVKEKKSCPRYSVRVIKGVNINESPQWLKKRLIHLGATPINNIVDITNYIMLSYGQPMHAFDYNNIDGRKIIVRQAHNNEKMIDLDNKAHILKENDLVISDTKKPIAIAGIFGSLDSGISDNTKNIVLESAFFNSINIRLASKRLNLATEASYRFERGTDIGMSVNALDYATELIIQEAGGRAYKEIDIYKKSKSKRIKIDYQRIKKLIGIKIADTTINKILTSLGFSTEDSYAIVPTWRTDIVILEDIVEEIGRIYGYNKLPKTSLKSKKINNRKSVWYKKELIRDILIKIGLTEVYNYSFVSAKDLGNFCLKPDVINKLVNPLSPECAYMRPNMLIGLVKTIAKNPSDDPIEIFEIGEAFQGKKEYTELSIAVSGHKNRKIDDILSQLSKSLKINLSQLRKISAIREINKDILTKYKIRKPSITTFSVFIKDLLKVGQLPKFQILNINKHHMYKEISKFPSVQRDLAVVIDSEITPEKIKEELLKEEMVKTVECFDEYTSNKFGINKKSLAFRINYVSNERTLNKEEVNRIQEKILINLINKFGAKLRR